MLYGLTAVTMLDRPVQAPSTVAAESVAPAPPPPAPAAAPRVEHLLDAPVTAGADETVAEDRFAALAIEPVSRLRRYYDRIGFDLTGVRSHGRVPRLILAALPGDIHRIDQPRQRKMLFLQTTLPLILHVNERILADRGRVAALRDHAAAGGDLTAADKKWLFTLSRDYGAGGKNPDPENPDFDGLLARVDIVPPSLALAQSAEESGWGTSRFAREGNALFGQRTWRGPKGMVPKRRADGERFRVRAFDSLLDGVWAYAYNLNTHRAYRQFRASRAALRATGKSLTGAALIGTLQKYSERGMDYIRTIRTIIRVNSLTQFDKARLASPPVLPPEPSSGA